MMFGCRRGPGAYGYCRLLMLRITSGLKTMARRWCYLAWRHACKFDSVKLRGFDLHDITVVFRLLSGRSRKAVCVSVCDSYVFVRGFEKRIVE